MQSKCKKISRLPLAATLIVLTAVLTSCLTTPVKPVATIEYRYIPLPAIIWPVFPDPKGNVERDHETGRVTMSLDYWLAITHYVIGIETGIKKLEAHADD